MDYSQYHLSRFKGPRMVALSEGNGSGTKLFQSLLDGHSEVLMVPGYPFMYYYPFWEFYIAPVGDNSWQLVLNQLLLRFAPVFDTRINPGSEDLDKLGKNQDQYLIIDIERFSDAFLAIVDGIPIKAKYGLLALHYAYALARGEDLAQKKVLVYHVHVFDYVKRYVYEDFPDLLVIASVRDPRPNLGRRELNSIIKPNQIKFRETDARLMSQRAYRQTTKFLLDGLDALNSVPMKHCRVFKHEDLAKRLSEVMWQTAAFLGINFEDIMLQPSFASLEWKTSFYDFDTSNIVNPEVLSNSWRQIESPRDIFVIEGMNIDYIEKYGYAPCEYYRDSVFGRLRLLAMIMLPARLEMQRFWELFGPKGMCIFFLALSKESANLKKLISYRSNLFYVLKWTNDGINFSRNRYYEIFLKGNQSKILAQWVYFAEGCVKYVCVFLRTPWERILRISYNYQALWRGIRDGRYLPDLL